MEGAAERRRFLDRVALSLIPEHGEVAAGYDRALRERNRLIRDEVRDPGWFDAHRGADGGHRRERLGGEPGGRRWRGCAAAPAGAFPVAELRARGRGAAGRGGAARRPGARGAAATSRRGGRWSGRIATISAAIYAAKGVAARLCSTGEQKALLISLVLANAWAVAEDFGAAPVLLLDEVAAHLDAERPPGAL